MDESFHITHITSEINFPLLSAGREHPGLQEEYGSLQNLKKEKQEHENQLGYAWIVSWLSSPDDDISGSLSQRQDYENFLARTSWFNKLCRFVQESKS